MATSEASVVKGIRAFGYGKFIKVTNARLFLQAINASSDLVFHGTWRLSFLMVPLRSSFKGSCSSAACGIL